LSEGFKVSQIVSKLNTTRLIAIGSLSVLLLILQLIPATINSFASTRVIAPGPLLFYFASILVLATKLVEISGMEIQTKLLFHPITIFGSLVVGGIGCYLGYSIYNKIKNTAVVKRIKGNNDQ